MHPGQVADLSQGQQVEGYDHSCSHSHLQPFYSHVKKKVFSWVVLLCLKNLRSLFSVCLDCSLKLCLTMLLQLKEVYGHLYIHSSFKVQCISLRFRPELFTGLLQELDFSPPHSFCCRFAAVLGIIVHFLQLWPFQYTEEFMVNSGITSCQGPVAAKQAKVIFPPPPC